jgi:hypothetical protein
MALATGNTVTTTGTGGSDYVALGQGEYVCQVVWAGSAGDLDLQAGDGTNFTDVLDASGNVVNITSSYATVVVGGMSYRADVNTHTSAATLTFHQVK